MIRQHQNIWRVYMDLLSNLMGLVVIGGAGLMIMVGGAVVQNSKNAAPFEQRCQGARDATDQPHIETDGRSGQKIVDLVSEDKTRHWFRRTSSCEIEVRFPDIKFDIQAPSFSSAALGQGSEYGMVEQFCRDAYTAALYKKKGELGASI